MQNITVGKKRNVTFIPLDQFGNPNPKDPQGNPLQVAGVPVWTVDQPGFTLFPSPDGLNCDVEADTVGATALLTCTADRGDGVMVTGIADITAIAATGPVAVIGSLMLQFGPETDL